MTDLDALDNSSAPSGSTGLLQSDLTGTRVARVNSYHGDNSPQSASAWYATGKTGAPGTADQDNGVVYDMVGNQFRIRVDCNLNVKQFGAKGDGVNDDTAAIQSATDFLGSNGGGELFFPTGSYTVHNPNPSRNLFAALYIRYSGVHWRGEGPGVTTIKARTGGDYSLLHVRKLPIKNGQIKIFGGSVRAMSFDGSFVQDGTEDRNSTILTQGLSNFVFEDLHIANSSAYGIGMQNGGYVGVRLSRITIEDTAQDGIDVKNNGNNISDCSMTNILVRRFGRASSPSFPWAGIDIMGPGWLLGNIHVKDFGDLGDCYAGIRFKQGETKDKRGLGAQYASLSNFFVQANLKGSGTDPHGIQISMRNVNVSNGSVLDCRGAGIYVQQRECTVSNINVANCGMGFQLDVSSYKTNGNRTSLVNCTARKCKDSGFWVTTDENSCSNCVGRTCGIGATFTAKSAKNRFIAGELANSTTSRGTELVDDGSRNVFFEVVGL